MSVNKKKRQSSCLKELSPRAQNQNSGVPAIRGFILYLWYWVGSKHLDQLYEGTFFFFLFFKINLLIAVASLDQLNSDILGNVWNKQFVNSTESTM